ncbi:MAG TPA: DUF882 domain-containing protein [Gammaproteobacteria bacterium]
MTFSITRRRAVVGGLTALAACAPWTRSAASLAAGPRRLSFYHLHTTERLDIVYREHGELVPDALAAIDHLLRDFRTGEAHPIDVNLLDTLAVLFDAFGQRGRFEVISGYRSPRTNEALRRSTTGVAKDSWHMSGRAIDVRLTSVPTTALRDTAIALARGGVGYYAESNFVHLDTGKVRAW